jgi:hypothetical protein
MLTSIAWMNAFSYSYSMARCKLAAFVLSLLRFGSQLSAFRT